MLDDETVKCGGGGGPTKEHISENNLIELAQYWKILLHLCRLIGTTTKMIELDNQRNNRSNCKADEPGISPCQRPVLFS